MFTNGRAVATPRFRAAADADAMPAAAVMAAAPSRAALCSQTGPLARRAGTSPPSHRHCAGAGPRAAPARAPRLGGIGASVCRSLAGRCAQGQTQHAKPGQNEGGLIQARLDRPRTKSILINHHVCMPAFGGSVPRTRAQRRPGGAHPPPPPHPSPAGPAGAAPLGMRADPNRRPGARRRRRGEGDGWKALPQPTNSQHEARGKRFESARALARSNAARGRALRLVGASSRREGGGRSPPAPHPRR